MDLGVDWDAGELEQRIAEYDGILIRSATKMTADLIARADRLKVIGRAGVGVETSTSPPRPARGSSSPTRRSRTSSPPRSTRWRCFSRSLATSRRPTPSSRQVAGNARSTPASSLEKTLGILGFGLLHAELAVALGAHERIEREHAHPEAAGALGHELPEVARSRGSRASSRRARRRSTSSVPSDLP